MPSAVGSLNVASVSDNTTLPAITVAVTGSTYPLPWLVMVNEPNVPLLAREAVAVACMPPCAIVILVGALISIVGGAKYLCLGDNTSILSTAPVVSSGNAKVIS